MKVRVSEPHGLDLGQDCGSIGPWSLPKPYPSEQTLTLTHLLLLLLLLPPLCGPAEGLLHGWWQVGA